MAALAQQPSSTISSDETMVVTASRFEQSIDNVIAPVSVVTKQDIEQSQAKTLTDVLRRLPGVEVSVDGGIGQRASLFLRGTNSNHTLVLIDGVRMNDSITSGTNLNRIPITQIERVELIRGAGAAMYGSDAIGGVLNIITRSQRGSESRSISLGGGSNAYAEASFSSTTDVSDNGHLKVAAGFQQTDGFNVNPQPGLNDDDRHGFEGSQGMINYEHQLSEQWTAFSSLRWFDNTAQYNHCKTYDDFWVDCIETVIADNDSQSLNIAGRAEYQSDKYRTSILASYQRSENVDTYNGGAVTVSHLDVEQTNLQWINQYQVNSNVIINGGVDWRREVLGDDALSWGGPHSAAGEKRDVTGIYGATTYTLAALTVQASARVDQHDEYDTYNTWSLGAAYQLNAAHQVTASIGTAFKAPSFTSLASNPDLKPEESLNKEIGVTGYYPLFDWSLALYDNKVDNLQIYYVDQWTPHNLDARIKGAELGVNFNTGIVRHAVNAEYKKHEDTKGVQLARRARDNYKWLSEVSLGELDLSLSYVYTGSRSNLPTDDLSQLTTLSSYGLWDLGAAYWATPALVIRGRVDNLTNEKYETSGGYPSPERAYYLSIDYQF